MFTLGAPAPILAWQCITPRIQKYVATGNNGEQRNSETLCQTVLRSLPRRIYSMGSRGCGLQGSSLTMWSRKQPTRLTFRRDPGHRLWLILETMFLGSRPRIMNVDNRPVRSTLYLRGLVVCSRNWETTRWQVEQPCLALPTLSITQLESKQATIDANLEPYIHRRSYRSWGDQNPKYPHL